MTVLPEEAEGAALTASRRQTTPITHPVQVDELSSHSGFQKAPSALDRGLDIAAEPTGHVVVPTGPSRPVSPGDPPHEMALDDLVQPSSFLGNEHLAVTSTTSDTAT